MPSIRMAQNKVNGMEHGPILSAWSVFPPYQKITVNGHITNWKHVTESGILYSAPCCRGGPYTTVLFAVHFWSWPDCYRWGMRRKGEKKNKNDEEESWSRIWRILMMVYNPGLWTLSIVWSYKYEKTQRSGNWICFCSRVKGGMHQLCWVP
jgi:hypothetical protein